MYCADAGVYVGQSTNVTIRHYYAHHNVAGIEIENCINSDVYKTKQKITPVVFWSLIYPNSFRQMAEMQKFGIMIV